MITRLRVTTPRQCREFNTGRNTFVRLTAYSVIVQSYRHRTYHAKNNIIIKKFVFNVYNFVSINYQNETTV